jgi:hypothetical protein
VSTEWTEYQGIWLCPGLQENGREHAVATLRRYFERTDNGQHIFTGGAWDTFDPSGRRDSSANFFTADDILSCTLLSTPIGAPAALKLLGPDAGQRFSTLLARIPIDRDFARLT